MIDYVLRTNQTHNSYRLHETVRQQAIYNEAGVKIQAVMFIWDDEDALSRIFVVDGNI